MAVKVATAEMLLDSLMENQNVSAAVLVDDRGYIIDQRGSAACLKSADTTQAPAERSKQPNENLYLVEAGEDFLIVVFDDRLNFERLKPVVDGTLAEFGMAPADDD
jgi:hypothetical protein